VRLVAAAAILGACGGGSDENRTPTDLVLVSGNNQTGGAGLALALPLTVRVEDATGDPVSGVSVAFAVTAGGGSVQSTSVTTNGQGQAGTTWTVGTLAGALNTATATAAGLDGSPITFDATVTAGPVATVTVTQGDGQTAEVGQPLAQAVTVEVKDAYDNVAAAMLVTWTVTGGNGTVPLPITQSDAQGIASTTWTLGYFLGTGHTLRAQAGTVQVTVAATATLSAGSTLVIAAGDNQTGAAGQQLANPLSVRVQAAGGQNIANVPMDWTVASGGGTVSQPQTLTNGSGIASVAWTLGPGGGTQTITATNASLTPTFETLSATSVVPPPSTITGTVTLADIELSAFRAIRTLRLGLQRAASRLLGRAELPAVPRPRRAARTPDPYRDDLLVRFKPGAIGAPAALRARATLSAAQSVGQAIRSRLTAHAAPGKVAITGVSPVILTARLTVEAGKADSVAKALTLDPAVESVGRDGRVRAHLAPVRPGVIPNDAFFPIQSWHYSMIDLPRAWSITTGSPNVIVAVLDNGAVFHHPGVGAVGATYLTGGGNFRNDGYDFVHVSTTFLCSAQGGGAIDNAGDGNGYDPDPSTPDDREPENGTGQPCERSSLGSHGTHVAGTIGGLGNDGANVTGVNWTVSIRPIRVLGVSDGSYFDIAQGVLYAGGLPADNGSGGVLAPPAQPSRIINMSLGGPCLVGPDPLHDAVQAVTNPGLPNGGALVVVSSGNDGTSEAPCPAAYDEVLAVGAIGPDGTRASYSTYGSSFVDIAAPGGDFPNPIDGSFGILSTTCDFLTTPPPAPCTPNYGFYVGTSMASPHVAGVAALLLADNPGLTPDQLRTRLLSYTTPLSAGMEIGNLVNARNALTQTTAPARQLYVRAVDAATGATVATTAATPGAPYSLNSLPDGNFFVVAGEDESGDGEIGVPGRRFGAFGGVSSPTVVAVNSSAGGYAAFAAGYPIEEESNNTTASASRLIVDGAARGDLNNADVTDMFVVQIGSAGTYTFETTGLFGAFCGYALDLDTVLDLFNTDQDVVGSSVDIDTGNRNFCSRITMSLTSGTYYLRVTRDLIQGVPHNGRYIVQARAGP
jgi:subtilisin family serine protease